MDDIDRLRDDILREAAEAGAPEALEAIRFSALGRRGRLTERMRGLGALDPETRRAAGVALNQAKDLIAAALAEAAERRGRAAGTAQLAGERADVTLPVLPGPPAGSDAGYIHPISQTVDEIIAIFG